MSDATSPDDPESDEAQRKRDADAAEFSAWADAKIAQIPRLVAEALLQPDGVTVPTGVWQAVAADLGVERFDALASADPVALHALLREKWREQRLPEEHGPAA